VIPIVKYEGPYKICHLCRNGNFPADKHHVINMLYVGADTCENYYIAGLKGKILDHLCDPLRYFAYEPCGCKSRTRSISETTDDQVEYMSLLLPLGVIAPALLALIFWFQRRMRPVGEVAPILRRLSSVGNQRPN